MEEKEKITSIEAIEGSEIVRDGFTIHVKRMCIGFIWYTVSDSSEESRYHMLVPCETFSILNERVKFEKMNETSITLTFQQAIESSIK